MKALVSYSTFVTYTYYGHPVDRVTVSVDCDDDLPESVKQLIRENAAHHIAHIPVHTFPVAGAHASLLDEYFKREPHLSPPMRSL